MQRKRNLVNSPKLAELKRRKRRILLEKILICVLAVVIVVGALAYFSRIKKLNIENISVEGNKVIDTELIKTSAEKELAGKYLWLFPKSNILLYPESKIKSAIGENYKRLKDIEISQKGNSLNISMSERVPAYTWCGMEPKGSGTENCYFLDSEGYIFDAAPYFSGEVYFKFYGAPSPQSESVPVGENPSGSYVARGYFERLIAFKDILTALGVKPVSLYIDTNDEINIALSKQKASGTEPKILVKRDSDFDRVAENLRAAINTEPLKGEFAKNYSNLEYIDLRFGNKVYYRFK